MLKNDPPDDVPDQPPADFQTGLPWNPLFELSPFAWLTSFVPPLPTLPPPFSQARRPDYRDQ